MFFPEYVWVPGSNQTRRCTSWAWRRTTRTGSVQCWGFFLEVISNILTKSWVNIKMRVEHLKAGGGGPHHQAGTKPRGGHPAPQVSYSIKIVSGFQKDWIMIATKLKLNIFAKIYKDFLFVRTAMLIGSSKEHIWKNFDLWSLFGFGLRSSQLPTTVHRDTASSDAFQKTDVWAALKLKRGTVLSLITFWMEAQFYSSSLTHSLKSQPGSLTRPILSIPLFLTAVTKNSLLQYLFLYIWFQSK